MGVCPFCKNQLMLFLSSLALKTQKAEILRKIQFFIYVSGSFYKQIFYAVSNYGSKQFFNISKKMILLEVFDFVCVFTFA